MRHCITSVVEVYFHYFIPLINFSMKYFFNKEKTPDDFLFFTACFCISFLIFFFRNPDPFINPILYTEDGLYIGGILNLGFWQTVSSSRTDYIAFFNVFLTQISLWLNTIIYRGNIADIPQSMALISYAFFAFVATLPCLLFKHRLSNAAILVSILWCSLFPLGQSDQEVIGRISNIGYSFFYVAFLLSYYRLSNTGNQLESIEESNSSKRILIIMLVDISLIACAMTNPVVYLLIPTTLLSYFTYSHQNRLNFIRKDHVTFISLCASLSFLAYIALTRIHISNLHSASNYLDMPFVYSNFVEMTLARSILYPLIYSVYHSLNDYIVILLFLAYILLFFIFSTDKWKDFYIFGFYSLMCFILSSCMFRPGLSNYFKQYSVPTYDRFYYTQNLIVIFMTIVLVNNILENRRLMIKTLKNLFIFFCMLVPCQDVTLVSTFGNSNQFKEIGNFEQNLIVSINNSLFMNLIQIEHEKFNSLTPYLYNGDFDSDNYYYLHSKAINRENGSVLVIQIYPITWSMGIPRDVAQNSVNQSKLYVSKNLMCNQ